MLKNDDMFPTTHPLPPAIINKIEQCKKAHKRAEDLARWIDGKHQPTAELVDRVQERMAFNRRYEGSKEAFNELGQRLEDLQHCLDSIDRDAEDDFACLQGFEQTMRDESAELVRMLDAWLMETYGVSLPLNVPEPPDFEAPFDLRIVEDAEAVCDQREVEDQAEEAELQALPFQPEGNIMNRTWIIGEADDRIREARRQIEDASDQVQKLQRVKAAQETGDHSYDHDIPEYLGLDEALEEAEGAIVSWTETLESSIEGARQLGMEVTSNGSVVHIPLPPAKPWSSQCSDIAWGAQEPDEEQDQTEEEEAAMITEVTAMIEPWLDEVDDTMSVDEIEQMPPLAGTPTSDIPEEWIDWELRPGKELTEPTPADSVSQPDHHRIDLGYSIYRNELDRLRDMQEAARAELPQDAVPDMTASRAASDG